jgi:hypothetical protein
VVWTTGGRSAHVFYVSSSSRNVSGIFHVKLTMCSETIVLVCLRCDFHDAHHIDREVSTEGNVMLTLFKRIRSVIEVAGARLYNLASSLHTSGAMRRRYGRKYHARQFR